MGIRRLRLKLRARNDLVDTDRARQQPDSGNRHTALLAVARNDRRIKQRTGVVAVRQRKSEVLLGVFHEQLQAGFLEPLRHERVDKWPQRLRGTRWLAQDEPLGRGLRQTEERPGLFLRGEGGLAGAI